MDDARNLIPRRGRAAQPLLLTVERQLTHEDLYRLATDPDAARVAPPMIQKATAIHHAAARHLASGRSVQETAFLVGRTEQRISDLQNHDPTFQELVRVYSKNIEEVVITDAQRMQIKLAHLGELVVDDLIETAEDPEKLATVSTGEKRQIAQMALDRTVAPPKAAAPTVVAPLKATFNIGTRDIRPGEPESTTITIESTPVSEEK